MVNATLINATKALVNSSNALNTSSSSFLHNLADPIVLSFVLPILLVIVITIFLVRNAMPLSSFLYANARIQARSNYMASGILSNLIEAKSLSEFRSLLKDTHYGEELEKSKDDLRDIHIVLEKEFINSFTDLVKLSPEKSKQLFNAYMIFYETKIRPAFPY